MEVTFETMPLKTAFVISVCGFVFFYHSYTTSLAPMSNHTSIQDMTGRYSLINREQCSELLRTIM